MLPPSSAQQPTERSPSRGARPLVRVPVAPGRSSIPALMSALDAALDGVGPAIAPIPVVSAATSNEYVMSVLDAVRPDDPTHPLESDDVAVVMATSGSTGAPRGVLLTAAQLTSMTDVANSARFGAGDRPQWVLALPVTSMGGMNVVVRARAVGRPPVVVDSLGGAGPFTPQGFEQAIDEAVRSSSDVRTSLVAAQLARLLADPRGRESLAACSAVLVGGGPLRESLAAAASDAGVRVVTTYGATETSGGCVFDGRPLPGVAVSSAANDGTLVISGPCVADGYRLRPDLGATLGAGRFVTSDVGVVGADGVVVVHGRSDDIAIVNGINVSTEAVEGVIASLSGVRGAAVVVLRAADAEPRLWALVEPDQPMHEDELREAIARATSTRLGPAARPAGVTFVAALAQLPNGKADRNALRAQAQWHAANDEGS